jgi:hypothetical protein
MAHQFELMKARIQELEAANAAHTTRKARKRKRLQTGGTLSTKEGRALAAAKAGGSKSRRLNAREGGEAERSTARQRRCGRCGETGHNARTCAEVKEETSESDATTVYIFSNDSVA